MKTKQVVAVFLISVLFLIGCNDKDDDILSVPEIEDVITSEYPEAKQEVMETFGAIAQSITDGAGKGSDGIHMDQLISFHAYGDKFTEFNDGKSFDSAGNENNERTFFGDTVDEDGVLKFAAMEGTLKVAVYYGNVANLTFVSDFELMIGGVKNTVHNLITLLFVKTEGEWKMVHEHHSPLK